MIRIMRITFRPLWLAMRASLLLALLPAALLLPMQASADPDGRASVAAELARIDGEMPGRFGVYIKWLDDGHEVSHRADRDWYLASTIKVPLAVVVLQRVEARELSLDQELVLAEADFVDGSGELLYAEPGTRYTVDELLRNMNNSAKLSVPANSGRSRPSCRSGTMPTARSTPTCRG